MSQRSWILRDSCSAKGRPRTKSTGNPPESSRLPKQALVSQEATARSVRVVVEMHVLLLGRYEQRDPQGWEHWVKVELPHYGIVLRGR
jgi:hypothetical protein